MIFFLSYYSSKLFKVHWDALLSLWYFSIVKGSCVLFSKSQNTALNIMTTYLQLQHHGTKMVKKRSRTRASHSIAKHKHTVALFPAHTQPGWPSPAHIALSSCALTVISAKSTCLSFSVWISRKTDSPVSSHMPPISATLFRCCLQLASVWMHRGTGGCCVWCSAERESEKEKNYSQLSTYSQMQLSAHSELHANV